MIWIQPLHSRLPYPQSGATHLEIELGGSLMRCLRLARNWFAACPEPLLEMQTFCVNPSLLTGMDDLEAGAVIARPAGWLEVDEDLVYAFLHVGRSALWFKVCTNQDEVLETTPIRLEDVPPFEVSDTVPPEQEVVSLVTLALELTIRHDGEFGRDALEELLHNLDFSLEQQRGSGCLAPDDVDGVTQDFVFYDLDVRRKEMT